jgi:hypothetical protein
MSTPLRKIAVLVALLMLLIFVVFVLNQTVQVMETARAVHPVFGDAVMWGLIFLYLGLLIAPAVLWFRLPKRISPPTLTEGPEYERFIFDFRRRLSRNARLRGVPLKSHTDIESALQVLDKQAHDAITSSASAVFLSTAVLQSGRLDALVVLAAQTRLIWRVAHIYYQRPSLRDFIQLYANVASTAFIAAGVEDVDVEVLLGTIFGSTVAAIPGMHLLASSVLTGSANAFLTLRVGMITKEYCRCTVKVEKRGLRRAATLQAAKLLGSIVRDGTARMGRAAMKSSAERLNDAFSWMTGRERPAPEQV